MVNLKSKESLRSEMKILRSKITAQRREQAEKDAFKALLDTFKGKSSILSYVPINHEFSISELNLHLANEKRLLLPKVEGSELRIFAVKDLSQELKRSSFGILEPISARCQEVSFKEIEVVLIPGLAFDKEGYRLGYGKGFYDQFLSQFPNKPDTIGIGFKEQMQTELLPKETFDIRLKEIKLF